MSWFSFFRRGPAAQPFTFHVEIDHEADGRVIADVREVPGVMAYGATEQEALSKVTALLMRVVAERLEHGEAAVELPSVTFQLLPA